MSGNLVRAGGRRLVFLEHGDLRRFLVDEILPAGGYVLGRSLLNLASGAAQVRERSALRFQEPNLHAQLLNRIVSGKVVIDHELVTRTYPLAQINEAFADLGRGGVGRGILLPHGGA